ncbi:MAG: Serine/threonine protein kinase [Myxococcaceae bacterium]|jgi:serine/threonine protein kinase|nr:Serine/threonine protein kinase [Myxococcaceae bacterium]
MCAQPAPAEPSLVGAVLGRKYRLLRLIGSGGMGAVYAAESLADGQKYAVKVLHHEFLTDEGVLGRFLDEGRTIQRLVHPNILRVTDTLQAEDGTPFLVMELLEGVPLSAYTQNGGHMAVMQAQMILQGMLAALGAAHAQGIVHRDLKPENVFLARDRAGQFQVKLLDFGIAKVMDAAGGIGNKTKTGMLLGTPAYMSPEQIKNSKDVDARSDLFSAGVMFYEMITGRPAFPAPTEFAKLTAVLTQEPMPVDRIDPHFAPLVPFVARALHKDRNVRFQSAGEMAHALAVAVGVEAPTSRIAQGLAELPQMPAGASPMTAPSPSHATPPPRASLISAPPMTPMPTTAEPYTEAVKSPGGTLASRPAPPIHDAPPQVVMVPPSSGFRARDSESRRGGIAPIVVVLLVVGALLAGFLLGFAVARSM